MRETDATVFRRLIALRQNPAFARAGLDELATLAENALEASFAAGTVVAASGARVPRLHLVIEGRIEMKRAASPLAWGPHEVFGLLEVLAGRRASDTATASIATRTLQLSGVELVDLLEDNFGILLSMLRELAISVAAIPATPAGSVAAGPETLGLVDRLILLRQQRWFARANLQGLAMLAQVSTETTWDAGEIVARAGEPASAGLFVIAGTLRTDDGATFGPGDEVGLVESIAGLHVPRTLTAVTPVRALVSTEAALFDVLEDHTALGLAMLSRMAQALLDAEPGAGVVIDGSN